MLERPNKQLTSEEIYKRISFDMIRNSYMKNKEKNVDKEFSGNFYTYVERVAEITGNIKVKNIFKGKRLNLFIKKKAKENCIYVAGKNSSTAYKMKNF